MPDALPDPDPNAELADLGEFGLIRHVGAIVAATAPRGGRARRPG
ncbi:hypothetical protein [Nocardioides sp. TF02-7]|nr:hypothetical protein [Nocardioides sp. TF02-7]